jgi:hypothetical protein
MLLPQEHSCRKTAFSSCIFGVDAVTRVPQNAWYSASGRRSGICTMPGFVAETAAIYGLRASAQPKIRGTLIKTSFRHGTASFK